MNGKTAKLLKKVSKQTKISYGALKQSWKKIPRPDRHIVRQRLINMLEE